MTSTSLNQRFYVICSRKYTSQVCVTILTYNSKNHISGGDENNSVLFNAKMSQTLQPTGWIMQYYATVLGRHQTWLNIECQYSGHVNSLCQIVCLSSLTISDNFMNLQDSHTVISGFNDDIKKKNDTAHINTKPQIIPYTLNQTTILFSTIYNYHNIKNILALTGCRSTWGINPRDNLVQVVLTAAAVPSRLPP